MNKTNFRRIIILFITIIFLFISFGCSDDDSNSNTSDTVLSGDEITKWGTAIWGTNKWNQ
jgi:hypothetical protein